jgi:tetratricopeptide (TPR) repeat protein
LNRSNNESYREKVERLRAELELPPEELVSERVRVRDEIVGLFKEIEERIVELQALKEEVRPLVERYREVFARAEPVSAVIRVDHLGSSTYRERGWSALAGGDYDRAVGELEKALALDPENSSNLAMLAWAHLRLQDWDKARPLLDRVLADDPTHPLGRTCMGYLRLRESKFAEAIESLSGVAREGTDRTATLYANLYLGVVYAERDMHRDAQALFRRALELGPNLTEAYWELGRSHQREGREDLALDVWKAGAENRFNPWGERCRSAAERLEALRGS